MKKLFLIVLVACYALAYEDTDSGSVSFEIGIGYLNSSFTGKQNSYLWNSRNKGYAKGIDIYVAANSYTTERFGISFGMGAEFLNGSWNDECRVGSGMGEYSYNYAIKVLNLTLAKTQDNQRHKEEKALIDKYAGTNYDKPFDKTQSYNPNQTGSQGYLYRSDGTAKRDKYDYVSVGANRGDYEKDTTACSDCFKYVGENKGSYTIKYYFEPKAADANGKKQGAYALNTENKGAIKGTDGNSYDYVGEGKGDYSVTQEEYYLYRYNGNVLNNSGLSCTTPNLNAKAWYAFLGAFYDVVRLEYFAVRVFGNIGVGYDMMKDKFSRASYYANGTDYQMIYTINSNQTPSQEKGSVYIPFTAGVRFIIANNHGIEFIGKYNLMKSKWKGTQNLHDGEFDGYNTPRFISIDTKITRDYSWGIRYVYEFRND